MKRYALLMSAVLVGSATLARAAITEVNQPDFSNTINLKINGTAGVVTTGDGKVMRLTSATPNQAGSFFSLTTIPATDFSAKFQFRITSPGGPVIAPNTSPGADGLVFVVQDVANNVGTGGEGIGYKNILTSIGVEFDTWANPDQHDPDSNHMGIDLNGVTDHGVGSPNTLPVAQPFDDGNKWFGWVDYNATTQILSASGNQTGTKPGSPMISRSVNLASILGSSSAFVGFTSGTGDDFGNHDILSFSFTKFIPDVPSGVPLPAAATGGLALMGALALGAGMRKLRGMTKLSV